MKFKFAHEMDLEELLSLHDVRDDKNVSYKVDEYPVKNGEFITLFDDYYYKVFLANKTCHGYWDGLNKEEYDINKLDNRSGIQLYHKHKIIGSYIEIGCLNKPASMTVIKNDFRGKGLGKFLFFATWKYFPFNIDFKHKKIINNISLNLIKTYFPKYKEICSIGHI